MLGVSSECVRARGSLALNAACISCLVHLKRTRHVPSCMKHYDSRSRECLPLSLTPSQSTGSAACLLLPQHTEMEYGALTHFTPARARINNNHSFAPRRPEDVKLWITGGSRDSGSALISSFHPRLETELCLRTNINVVNILSKQFNHVKHLWCLNQKGIKKLLLKCYK